MKAALIADESWLAQERGTLRRLIVGLVDETVNVVRVAPRAPDDRGEEQWTMSAEALWYPPTPWGWLRDHRIRGMASALRDLDVDVVHALDGSLDAIAGHLAQVLGVPALCGIWTDAELGAIRTGGGAPRCYVAASAALARTAKHRLGGAVRVEHVPPGVYATQDDSDHAPLGRVGESVCCVVAGNGRFDASYRALLEGIAELGDRVHGAMYFLYSTGPDQHSLWQAAERLGLMRRVSLVPGGTDARRLMTQADALILPQPLGGVRTVVLEAMGAGRPVFAVEDGAVDHLIDGRTARVLTQPDADRWAACITELGENPDLFVRLGRSARQYVLESHRASAFASGLHALYRHVATPVSIPFGR